MATALLSTFDELRQRASQLFPESEWFTTPDVGVFKEHTGPDGVEYDRELLERIAENCNDRIEATGDFCPACENHTPTAEQRAAGHPWPEVLGYFGPFRVVPMDEAGRTVYWIVADQHIRAEFADRARDTRRSVEMLESLAPEQRFFDPIALLKAATPRLDLGIVYSMSGERKIRYDAAFPGAANTYVPTDKERECSDGKMRMEAAGMDEEALIASVITAFMATDMGQWIQAKMQEDKAAAALKGEVEAKEELAEELGVGTEEEAGAPPSEGGGENEIDDKPADGMPSEEPAGGDEPGEPPMAEAKKPDEEKDRASAAGGKLQYAALQRQVHEQQTQIKALQAERREEKRRYELDALRMNYVFDADGEFELTKDYTDAQFKNHCEKVVTRYERIPVGTPSIARLTKMAPLPVGPKEVTREQVEKAVALSQKDKISYGEALDKIMGTAAA